MPDAPYDFNPLTNSGTVFEYVYSPYLGYGGIFTYASYANAKWNALEVNVRHPVSRNLFLTVAYTWQHGLSDVRGTNINEAGAGSQLVQNYYHPGSNYGNESFNATQVLAVSWIWALPWYQNAGGFRQASLGGWKYAGITTIQSGFPVDPGLSVPFQGLATRPDRTSVPIGGPKTPQEWFNPAAFVQPRAGFFGNAGTGIIRGPGIVNFDMAFYKDFKIKERHKFEFRAELFNIFNHTNFNGMSSTFGAGNFGQLTSAADPRIAEFALRYQF